MTNLDNAKYNDPAGLSFSCDDDRQLIASFSIPEAGSNHAFARELESYLFNPDTSFHLSGNVIAFYV